MIMKKKIWTILLAAMTAMQASAVDITDPNLIWDGKKIEDFKVYKDTKTIYIYTPGQFIALHDKWENYKSGDRGYSGWTIYLMNDIDLNNQNIQPLTIGWYDGHRFGGNFDGQGHTIKNIYIGGKEDDRALFGWIDNGRIENLRLENVYVEAGDGGNEHIGALCGKMENHSTISHCAVVNCTVKATDVDDGDEIGAICGYMKNDCNDILYCYSDATIEGRSQLGGIVGKVEKGGDGSSVQHCYFTGKIIHHDDEFYASIAGERYSQKLRNNFYLYRDDGVRGTGWDGGSADPSGEEIASCTEEQMKQPLLFSMYNDEYTLEDDQYVYPLNGYPELKVFLRYNPGDSFYTTNVGHMDSNEADSIPGYLRVISKEEVEKKKMVEDETISWTEVTSAVVTLEKAIGATGNNDFVVNGSLHSFFSPIPLTTTGLGANAFERLGTVNRVLLPETLDSIAVPQRHNVQKDFVFSNDLSGCAVKDDALYDMNHRLLLTALKSPETLTIHQEYADSIADYAFESMKDLKTLYVDTWVEAGREVDDGENPPPVLKLMGGHAFDGCPADLDIFIKDGTQYQLFLGYQASGGYGYSNADYWNLFYSEYQDVPNHMFTYFPVNRDETGLGTLMLAYPVELPDGVKAWWAKTISNKTLYVQALDTQVIPAFTPVLLTYEGTGPLYLSHYEGDKPGAATDYEKNLFKGSVDPGGHKMTSSEMMSNFFTLDKGNDNLMGFYPYHPKNNTLPSYTAWLALSDIPGGNELLISFDEPPTGIETVSGFKFQVSGSGWYDMFGRKLNGKPTQPGMYIHDGKAVVIE